MALKDHKIPGGFTYVKLADFPDNETITVYGAGIAPSTNPKYGDQPYFIGEDNQRITLPGRYIDYIRELMMDEDAYKELTAGVMIVKNSYEYDKGKTTPVFDFK